MKMLLLIFGLLFPTNGAEDAINISLADKIIGVWEINYSGENLMTYRKVRKLARDRGGIEFLADGTVRIKKNAGWCGTPPISYSTFEGTWKTNGENLIYSYDQYKQSLKTELKFIQGDKRSLTFELIYRTQFTF